MSKQPTRAGAVDFSFDLLTAVILNKLKDLGIIDDFKGQGEEAKIKRPNAKKFTAAKAQVNEKYLKKKMKQNPVAFTPEKPKPPPKTPEKPEEEIPEEELKDKPSDIRRQEEARKKAEEEARLKAEEEARLKAEEEAKMKPEEPPDYLNHPLNQALIELREENNTFKKKKILAKARKIYRDNKTSNTLPIKIVSQRKSGEPYRRNRDAKALLDPAKDKTTAIDKARVLRSDLIDDLKAEGGYESIPEADREAFLYFISSAHVRDPVRIVGEYFSNRQAFMAKMLRAWQANSNRPAYEAMSRDGVNIDSMTENMLDDYENRIMFEKVAEEEAEARKAEEEPVEPVEPVNPFQLPQGTRRIAIQEERAPRSEERPARTVSALDTGDLETMLNTADSDEEIKERIQDWIEVNTGRLQRAGQTGADVIRMISQIPALRDKRVWIPIIAGIVGAAYYFSQGETQEIDETDPVKVEAELNRLREQLQNLRVAKLNEEQEEQSFKERRKFRPEIREFNPERLNYFVSQEHEDLEKKELIDFKYVEEVAPTVAGVYTSDYKENPLVIGNIQNENIRFSNTQKQPMDYHPVGTYMLLDRIGKQMSEIRADFNKAVASMKYQERAQDSQFNQVWIPRVPPVEQPRKRRYRDMTDDAMKFASEPIVSLPRIDDKGVGATNAQRDFVTSYSYRRHYIK